MCTVRRMQAKKTYVNTVATRNDIVVDLDAIHRAICVCEPHDKPDATKRVDVQYMRLFA